MMFRLVLMSSAVMSFFTFAGVQAHELRPAVADVTVTASEVKVELLLSVEPLLAGIDLTEVMNTDDSPQAIIYDQLRSGFIKICGEQRNFIINNFILKISGIWESEYEFGLTYKFIDIINVYGVNENIIVNEFTCKFINSTCTKKR